MTALTGKMLLLKMIDLPKCATAVIPEVSLNTLREVHEFLKVICNINIYTGQVIIII